MNTPGTSATPPLAHSYWVALGELLTGPGFSGAHAPIAAAELDALADAGIQTILNIQRETEHGGHAAGDMDFTKRPQGPRISVTYIPIDRDFPDRDRIRFALDTIDTEIASARPVYLCGGEPIWSTEVIVGCWLQRHGLSGIEGPFGRVRQLRRAAELDIEFFVPPPIHNLVQSWPSPEAMPMANRLAGGVWGALVGDALGVPYEFKPGRSVDSVGWGVSGTHGQPPGTWSDDGGLLLALLDSLLTTGFDTDDQGRRFLNWLKGPDYKPGRLFDIGITTTAALFAIDSGVRAEEAGGRGELDNGNGSLMRILPIALFPGLGSAQIVDRSQRSSSVTHGHARARLTCALYCLVANRLLTGELDRHLALQSALSDLHDHCHDADRHEFDLVARYSKRTGSGYVVDTFWSAWDAFSGASSYEEAVKRAVAYGLDTDTTACVSGGLAGIYWGLSGIPGMWLMGMRGREIASKLIAQLVERFGA